MNIYLLTYLLVYQHTWIEPLVYLAKKLDETKQQTNRSTVRLLFYSMFTDDTTTSVVAFPEGLGGSQ